VQNVHRGVTGKYSAADFRNIIIKILYSANRRPTKKAAATGEYFSFVYTNRKYYTLFFVNCYSILRYLPADIRAQHWAMTAAMLD